MVSENEIIEITFKEVTTDNGLFCQFDDQHGVLLLDVKKPFSQSDFETIASIIDPYFAEHGELRGVILNAKKFPRWSNRHNRSEYINFAGNNHYKFKKAAFAMGGFFTKIIARMGRERVHPEIKIFKYNKISEAQDWVLY